MTSVDYKKQNEIQEGFIAHGEGYTNKAWTLLFKYKDEDNPHLHVTLGTMIWEGYGNSANCKEAVRFYKLAASKHNRSAYYRLGMAYHSGCRKYNHDNEEDAIKKDILLAKRYYEKAIEFCVESAKDRLAELFQDAEKIGIDLSKVKMSEEIDDEDKRLLSNDFIINLDYKKQVEIQEGFFAYGKKDYDKAWKLLFKHRDEDNPCLERTLGDMLYSGCGIGMNDKAAVIWYESAASKGDPIAYNKLGGVYFEGSENFKRDLLKAKHYFEKAVALGDATAVANIEILSKEAEKIGINLSQIKMIEDEKPFAESEKIGINLPDNENEVVGKDTSDDKEFKIYCPDGFKWLQDIDSTKPVVVKEWIHCPQIIRILNTLFEHQAGITNLSEGGIDDWECCLADTMYAFIVKNKLNKN